MNSSLYEYAKHENNAQTWRLEQLRHAGPYLTVLNDAFIIGPLIVHNTGHGLHAVNLEEGTVGADFSRAVTRNQAIKKFENECHGMRPGTYLFLNSLQAYNFWHWTMEALIRAVAAQEAGFKGYYIIPAAAEKNDFIVESLDMLGVSFDRILLYDGQPWHVESLWVPEPIKATHNLRHFPGLIDALRQKLLMTCMQPTIAAHRIYIARDDQSLERRVVNETELMDLLFRYDFQRIVMERFSLKEQISLISNADALVAPHGAGMVHSLFIKPRSLVIELFSNLYVNPCMMPVIDHLQHRYYMFSNHWLASNENGQIHADILCIDVTLKRELEREL